MSNLMTIYDFDGWLNFTTINLELVAWRQAANIFLSLIGLLARYLFFFFFFFFFIIYRRSSRNILGVPVFRIRIFTKIMDSY